MNILNWWDRQSPIQALALVLGVFVLAAGVAAVGRVPQTQVQAQPTAQLPLIIIPTSIPTIQPTSAPIVVQSAPPTVALPTPQPVIVEHVIERVVVQQVVVTAEPVQLQAIEQPDEELSPALLREAQDQ